MLIFALCYLILPYLLVQHSCYQKETFSCEHLKTACQISGNQLDSLDFFKNRQLLKEANFIRLDSVHPLSFEYTLLPSGLGLFEQVGR